MSARVGSGSTSTLVTLLMVPVLYAICVLDLKIVAWERSGAPPA